MGCGKGEREHEARDNFSMYLHLLRSRREEEKEEEEEEEEMHYYSSKPSFQVEKCRMKEGRRS